MKFDSFELEGIVDKLAAKHKVTLSMGARHSLMTPVLEAQAFGSVVTNDEVSKSLGQIIESTATHIDPLTGNSQQITSVSIAQAINRHYCNIPPFCAPAVKAKIK